MTAAAAVAMAAIGIAAIVWGAEAFAENLARAAARLGISTFALALLLAGAEPEELATAVAATVRGAPAIAFGDAVGANVTIILVALGVGAVITPLPFGRGVFRYGAFALPLLVGSVAFAWDGRLGRAEGALLVAGYVAYVVLIWIIERRPPALGESAEIAEALEDATPSGRVGRELGIVFAGLAAMVIGATLLVDGVRTLVEAEDHQARVSLTIVGFATGFELVVLAWSAARRGISEAVVAGVVGSVAYNATMTLGVAALVRPLEIVDAPLLHAPMAAMVAALVVVLSIALVRASITRAAGISLLAIYPLFVLVALL